MYELPLSEHLVKCRSHQSEIPTDMTDYQSQHSGQAPNLPEVVEQKSTLVIPSLRTDFLARVKTPKRPEYEATIINVILKKFGLVDPTGLFQGIQHQNRGLGAEDVIQTTCTYT